MTPFDARWLAVLRAHHSTQSRWLARDQPPTSLLITGHEGVGKAVFACDWAKALLCTNPGQDIWRADMGPTVGEIECSRPVGCGKCTSCLLIQKGQAIDLIELQPEVQESGRSGKISVDSLRTLKELQGKSPLMSRYRIIVIHEAHRMTVQASNALLKLLEEPPAQWLFWLTTTHRRNVLPTLVSRCQQLMLRPLDRATLQTMAVTFEIPKEIQPQAIKLSGGNLKILESMAQREFWDRRQMIVSLAKRDPALGSKPAVGPILDWCVERAEHLDWALLVLEGLALETAESKRWTFLKLVGEARKNLTSPINRKLLVQNLLSQFQLSA